MDMSVRCSGCGAGVTMAGCRDYPVIPPPPAATPHPRGSWEEIPLDRHAVYVALSVRRNNTAWVVGKES